MPKIHYSAPSSRGALAITAPNLTDEQKDKAVAALLADVLSSIDRVVAGTAKSEPDLASAPAPAAPEKQR